MQRHAAVALVLALTGCFSVDVNVGTGKLPNYAERVVHQDASPQGKIALIDVDGVISDASEEGFLSAQDSVLVATLEKLRLARADRDVKAVIVRLNTPGGGVSASDTLHHELMKFKEERRVPMVASFLSISASGGYYIACACDRIVAEPTSITGSIGVVALRVSLAELLGKIGVKVEAVKSGPNKDMGSPFRDATEAERRILQGLIDDNYARFLQVVAQGRQSVLSEEDVRRLADGRVYAAEQALRERLVDKIGYVLDAFAEAKTMAGLKSASLVMYSQKPSRLVNEYAAPDPGGPRLGSSLENRVRPLLGFKLYYLWEAAVLDR